MSTDEEKITFLKHPPMNAKMIEAMEGIEKQYGSRGHGAEGLWTGVDPGVAEYNARIDVKRCRETTNYLRAGSTWSGGFFRRPTPTQESADVLSAIQSYLDAIALRNDYQSPLATEGLSRYMGPPITIKAGEGVDLKPNFECMGGRPQLSYKICGNYRICRECRFKAVRDMLAPFGSFIFKIEYKLDYRSGQPAVTIIISPLTSGNVHVEANIELPPRRSEFMEVIAAETLWLRNAVAKRQATGLSIA